jgi:hypothetical protein
MIIASMTITLLMKIKTTLARPDVAARVNVMDQEPAAKSSLFVKELQELDLKNV